MLWVTDFACVIEMYVACVHVNVCVCVCVRMCVLNLVDFTAQHFLNYSIQCL
jgi:hypothetical protein